MGSCNFLNHQHWLNASPHKQAHLRASYQQPILFSALEEPRPLMPLNELSEMLLKDEFSARILKTGIFCFHFSFSWANKESNESHAG